MLQNKINSRDVKELFYLFSTILKYTAFREAPISVVIQRFLFVWLFVLACNFGAIY